MFAVDDQHIAGHSGVHFAQQKLPSLQNERNFITQDQLTKYIQ